MLYRLRVFISLLAITIPFTSSLAAGEERTLFTTVSQTTECNDMGIDAGNFIISVTMPKSGYTPRMPTIHHIKGFRFIKPARVNLQFNGSGLNDMCSYYLSIGEGSFPIIQVNNQEFAVKWLAFYAKQYNSPPLCARTAKGSMEIVASNYTTGDPICSVELSSH